MQKIPLRIPRGWRNLPEKRSQAHVIPNPIPEGTVTTKNRLCAAFALLATLLVSTASRAEIFRAYLASDGNDSHPCTLPQPCRLLPAALAAVASGGEIWLLDSANYNAATVTIGKSVTILAVPGAVGSVVAVGGPALSITAAGLVVALRNLVVVPLAGAGGTIGVSLTGASTVVIEDSVFANLPDKAVHVIGDGMTRIANATFRNNYHSVFAEDGATVDIAASRFSRNFTGALAQSNIADKYTRVTVSDSVFAIQNHGFSATAFNATAAATVYAIRCSLTHMTEYAMLVWAATPGSQAIISIGSSMIANNNYSWFKSGMTGTIASFGDNQFISNATSYGTLSQVSLN